jgi:hypothetical protein
MLKVLIVDDEKLPENPYPLSDSLKVEGHRGFDYGQQSLLAKAKPISWLDEFPSWWKAHHVYTKHEGEEIDLIPDEIKRFLSQFIQEEKNGHNR